MATAWSIMSRMGDILSCDTMNSAVLDIERTLSSRSPSRAISKLAIDYWDKPSVLAKAAVASPFFQTKTDEVRTIAIFFHSLSIGGGERVTRDLAKLWAQMGYRVIVLTNTEPQQDDYELPPSITRLTLPTYVGITATNYQTRCEALQRILQDNAVDLLVFAQWFSDCIAFDILSSRMLGIPTLLYIQSSFSLFFLDATLPSHYADIPLQYVAANGIVCLSETDRYFWSRFNENVLATNNPITLQPPTNPAELCGHSILWPARVHIDKRPDRVIPIMRELIKLVPDARLLMVGPEDPSIVESMRRQIDSELSDHIVFCGPQRAEDMERFYRQADAFLMTSEREGWSLSLGEALSSGLPCVIYDLPYLTLTRDNKAVIQIPQDDAPAAAQALAKVLTDKTLAHEMGEFGRSFIRELSKYDYEAFWVSCFASLCSSSTLPRISQEESIMWDEVFKAYKAHLKSFEQERGRLNFKIEHLAQQLAATKEELQQVRGSKSFRAGLILTMLPRAIKRALSKQ